VQLAAVTYSKKREGGGGLYWPGPQQLPVHRLQMEIHISDWTYKFQNKTGLNAKAYSELYKSRWVNSAVQEKTKH
jgi:hypothetical protein